MILHADVLNSWCTDRCPTK